MGEILGLRWQDIDFQSQFLSICQTLQHIKGRGLEFRHAAKTDKSRRSIAISSSVVDMLKKIKYQQNENKLLYGSLYQHHELIFATPEGKPMDLDGLSREFTLLIRRSNLPHVRFRDLRHTHATLLLQQGEHPKVVSERLGHSTIAITMDTYSHVLPNMQKEAADKLDDFLYRDNGF